MTDTKSKSKSLFRFVFLFLFFFFLSFVQLIPIALFHINVSTMSTSVEMLLTIFSYVVDILVIYWLYRKEFKQEFQDFKKNAMPYMDAAARYWIIGLVVMAVSNQLIGFFSPIKVAENEQAVQSLIHTVPFLSLITTAILAPIVEEVTFRKTFYDLFSNKWVFVLLSGFTFGALHVVSSFTSLYSLLYIIPYSSLGISFAYSLYKTKNIFTCISMHALHNGIITLLSIITMGWLL